MALATTSRKRVHKTSAHGYLAALLVALLPADCVRQLGMREAELGVLQQCRVGARGQAACVHMQSLLESLADTSLPEQGLVARVLLGVGPCLSVRKLRDLVSYETHVARRLDRPSDPSEGVGLRPIALQGSPAGVAQAAAGGRGFEDGRHDGLGGVRPSFDIALRSEGLAPRQKHRQMG